MAKKCAIYINNRSGRIKSVNVEAIKSRLCADFETEIFHLTDLSAEIVTEGYDRVVVCGGDGTLNSLLNAQTDPSTELYYCPFGTLNETSKIKGMSKLGQLREVGSANGRLFAYVLAAGTFTPLGYVVDEKRKQRFKLFAYFFRVVREYKVNRIACEIESGGRKMSGEYTLVMLVDSSRCFGFSFNKMYAPEDGKIHLLLIKSPKRGGLLGKMAIFFPFFRAFFIGFSKPYHSKHMSFEETDGVKLRLGGETDWCIDGEKLNLSGDVDVRIHRPTPPINISVF